MWLETVISPKLAWCDGRALEPFEPFEVVHPLHFGPAHSGADIEWPASNNLRVILEPNGLVFDDDATARTRGGALLKIIASRIEPGGVWWRLPTMLRVLDSPQASAGWPRGLAAPPAPWTEETLSVLGDEFLQRGLAVGRRFTDRTESEDPRWVPVRHGHRPFGANLKWRHGLLEAMTEGTQGDGFGFGRALALLAVCKPLQKLTLTCAPEADATEVTKGLIAGGLPCLEALRLAVVAGNVKEIQRSLPLLPGFGAAFPVLKTLEVVGAPRPMPVVG